MSDDDSFPIVRPCCGATAPDGFDRATGWVYLPHRKSCRYYRRPTARR